MCSISDFLFILANFSSQLLWNIYSRSDHILICAIEIYSKLKLFFNLIHFNDEHLLDTQGILKRLLNYFRILDKSHAVGHHAVGGPHSVDRQYHQLPALPPTPSFHNYGDAHASRLMMRPRIDESSMYAGEGQGWQAKNSFLYALQRVEQF
jgi:hypothetical protein